MSKRKQPSTTWFDTLSQDDRAKVLKYDSCRDAAEKEEIENRHDAVIFAYSEAAWEVDEYEKEYGVRVAAKTPKLFAETVPGATYEEARQNLIDNRLIRMMEKVARVRRARLRHAACLIDPAPIRQAVLTINPEKLVGHPALTQIRRMVRGQDPGDPDPNEDCLPRSVSLAEGDEERKELPPGCRWVSRSRPEDD